MQKELLMQAAFAGSTRTLHGQVKLKSPIDALKKALYTCLVVWLLGIMLIAVPFINWTLPAIFFAFGPVLGIGVYHVDRRAVESIDGDADCPQCGQHFEIHERHIKQPIYGACQHCKASYQVHVPELETRD